MTIRRALGLILAGVLGGALAGLFGVGGGIFMVPLLTLLAGMDQRRASATSLIAIVPASVVGTITYGIAGHLDVIAGIAISAGGSIGALIGSRLLRTLSLGWLRSSASPRRSGSDAVRLNGWSQRGGESGLLEGEAPGENLGGVLGAGGWAGLR